MGRTVRHIPFTRQSAADDPFLDRYRDMHAQVEHSGGVMLCLPEHILSFKLSGLQRLADGNSKIGRRMIEMQRYMEKKSRDVIDESDLTLSVQTQLIYPSGNLTALDGHPHRWIVIQELLSLVETHVPAFAKKYKGQVEIFRRSRGYPIIYFLSKEAEDGLNEMLIEDICMGRLPQLQLRYPKSQAAKKLLSQVLHGDEISPNQRRNVLNSFVDNGTVTKILFLVRGLISHRIIILCLKKRWNVQYGLHPDRPPLAVPFEAKGSPSARAEYGHPDTALMLTCLAFYQAGLTISQIKESFNMVVKSDDPSAAYDQWINGQNSLPESMQQWSLIDPENASHIEILWKHLGHDRQIIHYYLNHFVFPLHAKQFSSKPQASGWDIPLIAPDKSSNSHDGNNTAFKSRLTTGFSGTNDNKRMLPQTIQQQDLPSLLGTNAEVLSYLLEDRNQDFFLAAVKGKRLTETETLKLLKDQEIRVLIDAGAHILEMENEEVAQTWLAIDYQAEGAVFFGRGDQIMVRTRFKKDAIPLNASPLRNSLEKCVVYIDEGHTRGTDLKLPLNAKGAVTLGLNQTKDHTVQGMFPLIFFCVYEDHLRDNFANINSQPP